VMVPVTLFAVAIALNVIGLGLMGWRYWVGAGSVTYCRDW